MRLSSKIKRCELSPVRKFYPYEMAAVSVLPLLMLLLIHWRALSSSKRNLTVA